MNAKQVSYLKIGQHRGNQRIWLEGKRLEACGFTRGASYTTIFDVPGRRLLVKVDEKGDRIVSGRTNEEAFTPIIDICNAGVSQHLVQVMGGPVRVRAVFRSGIIEITVHEHERRQKEREERIKTHASTATVSVGTTCAGGGISCWALHEGLKDSGIHGVAEFILDMEGKYLQNAIDNNPFVTKETRIFEASLEEMDLEFLPQVDILNSSLPCTGFSKSGRAKNRLQNPESHESAGTAILGFLKIVEAVNPAIIINENVPTFSSSATCDLLRGYLQKLGYRIQERVLGRQMGGALESRDRHILVAVSSGLGNWDIEQIVASMPTPVALSEVLEDIPADDPVWKEYQYLAEKENRDRKAGKGFRRQLLTGNESSCGTIGRGYNKGRSTEPFLVSPVDPTKSRLFTVAEHCRVKGIPEAAVNGQNSTVAHEILGQSVLFGVFKSIGRFVGSLTADLVNCAPILPWPKKIYQIQLSLFAA
ncbi:MAG: DNA cytosine methyltransferase [Desulfobacteraceae bacterium]|nr:DNA cytosine methyltransferase [Desulfobacteraceae bacterium]